MQIILNGQPHHTHAPTVADLVQELGLASKRIAIEMNQQLLPKSCHASTVLTDGITLEIVHAVGGG